MPRGVRRLPKQRQQASEGVRWVSVARQEKVVAQELAHQDIQSVAIFCHEIFNIIVKAGVFPNTKCISRERMLFAYRYIGRIVFTHKSPIADWLQALVRTRIVSMMGFKEPLEEDWRLYNIIGGYLSDAENLGDYTAICERKYIIG